METVYDAPKAELIEPLKSEFGPPFFVTSLRKLCVLFVLTWGMYAVYWSYKQWFSQRRHAGTRVVPIGRAIFYVFFIHGLFELINERLKKQELAYWHYDSAAHWFVGLTVLMVVADLFIYRAASQPLWVLPLTAMVLTGKVVALAAMQRQANLASSDPKGESNDSLSGWNWVFIVLGGVYWTLAILGTIAIALGFQKA